MTTANQRTELLIGSDAVQQLAASSVMILGLGGVGSFAAEAIVRAGIGRVVLVDFDRVAESNLNRQLPALHSTLGRLKTEVMAERARDINPTCEIISFPERYEPASSEIILQLPIDCVIDAIDSLPDKIHLLTTCYQRNIPIVSSMGMANRLDADCIVTADISKTSGCPLSRKVRQALRREGIMNGIPVVFSSESPQNYSHTLAKLGSIAYIPSIAGLKLAALAIQQILNLKAPPQV